MMDINVAKAVPVRLTFNVLFRAVAVMSMTASIGHAYAATTCPTSEQITSTNHYSFSAPGVGSGWTGFSKTPHLPYLKPLTFEHAAIIEVQNSQTQQTLFSVTCDYNGPNGGAAVIMIMSTGQLARPVGADWNAKNECRTSVDKCSFDLFFNSKGPALIKSPATNETAQ